MQTRVRLNLNGVPLPVWDADSVRKMVTWFCSLEKISKRTQVGQDLSVFEITSLCDRLKDIPNSINLTLGDARYKVMVNIINAYAGHPPLSDIAPRSDGINEWQEGEDRALGVPSSLVGRHVQSGYFRYALGKQERCPPHLKMAGMLIKWKGWF